jgi:ubiquitin C-terminal hydrolase
VNQDLAGNRQQDVAEFMHHMKNSLCESSTAKDPDGSTPSSQGLEDKGDDPDCSCPVHRTFQGKTHSNLSCDKCRYSTRNIETFTDLSLDLQSARATRRSEVAKSKKESGEKTKKIKAEDGEDEEPLTLHDCLMSYTALEHIPDSRCEKCDSYGKTKQLSLHRLPPVLTLHLKVRRRRFVSLTPAFI